MKKKLCVLLGTIILLLTVYFSTFRVFEYQTAIVSRFGKLVRVIDQSGLHFKLPGDLETVFIFDRGIDVFDTPPTQLLLGDKKPIIISCFVGWIIENPSLFFESVGDTESAVEKISDIVNSRLSTILGDYSDENIININPEEVKLFEIEQKLINTTNLAAREKYGVKIVKAGIQRLAYPEVVIEAVYERMKSERTKEAAKIRAEGMEEANKIIAQADKKARELTARANKEALILKGNGDKEAMRIYAEAYGKDPEFFEFLKYLETYESILGKETVLIVSTQSDLFKYLDLDKQGSNKIDE